MIGPAALAAALAGALLASCGRAPEAEAGPGPAVSAAAPPLSGVASPNDPGAAAPPPSARRMTVLACGDILLARTPGKRAAEYGFRYLFEGVRDLVSGADVAFANLETPVSYLGEPYPGKPPNVTFRADPATLFGVAWAGFDVLSLANNHMNDYGPRAVDETLAYVDLLGIARCGAGRDLEEARRAAVLERDGVRFAFLAYAEGWWSVRGAESLRAAVAATRAEARLHGPEGLGVEATAHGAGHSVGHGVAHALEEHILEDVARVKDVIRPDYVFVSLHWGDEHQRAPNAFQRGLGRAVIDAGATAVLGHHPHVLQPIERYKHGLIAYSLGNFVFDMAAEATYETAALRLVLEGGRILRVEIEPLTIARGAYYPRAATPEEASARLRDLNRWSSRLSTPIVERAGKGVVDF